VGDFIFYFLFCSMSTVSALTALSMMHEYSASAKQKIKNKMVNRNIVILFSLVCLLGFFYESNAKEWEGRVDCTIDSQCAASGRICDKNRGYCLPRPATVCKDDADCAAEKDGKNFCRKEKCRRQDITKLLA